MAAVSIISFILFMFFSRYCPPGPISTTVGLVFEDCCVVPDDGTGVSILITGCDESDVPDPVVPADVVGEVITCTPGPVLIPPIPDE